MPNGLLRASKQAQVFTTQRFFRRALALAGRLPWFAFLIWRCGLAISSHPIGSLKVIRDRSVGACSVPKSILVCDPAPIGIL